MLLRVAFALLVLVLVPSAATAQKRVALVIGNSAYKHTGALANPKNDASDMSAALKKHGFEVLEGFDLDKAAFDHRIKDFAMALERATAGVFFYAGHGLQVGGVNYLVPVDAELTSAVALEFEMVRLDVVHRVMEHQTNSNVLFLDACRDNPLARNLARALGTRSAEIGHGLAAVQSGSGSLISFSTQPGNTALDGAGRNSPFSAALVRNINTSDDDLSALLISVRNDVMKETQGKQVPWEHSALTGRFYFTAAGKAAASPVPTLAPTSTWRLSEAAEAWDRIKDTDQVTVLERFIGHYKDTFFAELAQLRIDDLKKQQAATTRPVREPTPPVATLSRPPAGGPPQASAVERCGGVQVAVGPTELRCIQVGTGQAFRDCADCPEMVVVPAGRFTMGSPANEPSRADDEGPTHWVTIGKPFAVGRFAVTRGEFAAFTKETGLKIEEGCWAWTGAEWKEQKERSWRSPGFTQNDRHPVVCVNWDDAKAFVNWLAKKTGRDYRLLSEAEREYVTRAGTSTTFWWGSTISPAQANYDPKEPYGGGEANGEWRQRTVPVDSFKANPWGLYQVHGNVFEWVEDCYHDTYNGAPSDGAAWVSGDCGHRVLRGGSWGSIPRLLRAAYRYWNSTGYRFASRSLRVARTLTP